MKKLLSLLLLLGLCTATQARSPQASGPTLVLTFDDAAGEANSPGRATFTRPIQESRTISTQRFICSVYSLIRFVGNS